MDLGELWDIQYYDIPPEVWDPLVSDALGTITERLKITFQNILVHRSWLVEWSSHPYPERWIPVNLQATAGNSSLSMLLDFVFLFFIPSLSRLYLFEQCLKFSITSTSCLFASLKIITLCIL